VRFCRNFLAGLCTVTVEADRSAYRCLRTGCENSLLTAPQCPDAWSPGSRGILLYPCPRRTQRATENQTGWWLLEPGMPSDRHTGGFAQIMPLALFSPELHRGFSTPDQAALFDGIGGAAFRSKPMRVPIPATFGDGVEMACQSTRAWEGAPAALAAVIPGRARRNLLRWPSLPGAWCGRHGWQRDWHAWKGRGR
jgi:hypothetical protein